MSDVRAAANNRMTQIGESWSEIRSGYSRRVAEYQCSCGTKIVCLVGNVNSGRTTSCGCFDRQRRLTQNGMSSSCEYNTWRSMISRCCRVNHPKYSNYGGRGIVVCDRWHNSNPQGFQNFLADMGERPEGMTLDRIDSNGNYEPTNCQWADRSQQRRNSRQNLLVLTINNKSMPAIDWAKENGAASYDCILKRKLRGWTDEDAVFASQQNGGPLSRSVPVPGASETTTEGGG